MHETTVEQFRHFRPEHPFNRQYAKTSDAPANVITWYDAAAFCNWLSQQEGIPADQWCYEPDQQFANGMRIRPNYPELSGYRLPTEPEWEFACRCGTTTARFFGDLDSLVHQYGWFTKNSGDNALSPVGSLRPNGHGLFGCYGNVSEWCQDFPIRYLKDRALAADFEQSGFLEVVNSQSRALRGGSFFAYAKLMRSAYRSLNRPDTQNIDIGFRVARTYSLRP
jgi:formylglycine-generating enzyme required for sulfatase activity